MKIEIHRIFLGWGILFFILGLFRYLTFGEQISLGICLILSLGFFITSRVYFKLKSRLDPSLIPIHFWMAIPAAILFMMCYFEISGFIPSRFYTEAESVYPNIAEKHTILNISITISSIVFTVSYLIFAFNIFKAFLEKEK